MARIWTNCYPPNGVQKKVQDGSVLPFHPNLTLLGREEGPCHRSRWSPCSTPCCRTSRKIQGTTCMFFPILKETDSNSNNLVWKLTRSCAQEIWTAEKSEIIYEPSQTIPSLWLVSARYYPLFQLFLKNLRASLVSQKKKPSIKEVSKLVLFMDTILSQVVTDKFYPHKP